MRNRSSLAVRRHQLVISVSPHFLHILHFQRGLFGWKRKNSAQLALSEGEEFVDDIQKQLSKSILQWKIPRKVYAYWVLAGDILGIVPSVASDTTLAAALPFGAGDVRTQPDLFSASENPSFMWIHKDWIAEIERISDHCQLSLTEVFARSQVFQRTAAQFKDAFKAVLEQDDRQYFLHIFGPTGEMLRTIALDQQDPAALQTTLQAEFASLNSGYLNESPDRAHLLAPAQLITAPSEWHGFDCHPLAPVHYLDLLEQLWRSDLEGIVIRSTEEDVVSDLKLWSVVLSATGLVVLGLMSWHNSKLQLQIEDGEAQARKDLPKVQEAKSLKIAAIKMAEAVQAAKLIREDTETMNEFTQVLANFPPSPATLLFVRANENSIAFVGTGDESSLKWIQERNYPGYEPLTEFPVPDFLKNAQPIIHFQSRKLVPTNAAATTPVAAASTRSPDKVAR